MTHAEVTTILRQFNEWRRGDYEPSEQPAPPDPREIGEAIDAAVEMIDRGAQETAALRAKVERMTKRLRLILEEPKENMSDSKALREIVRQARLALEESK